MDFPCIALLTDFGEQDGFVGVVKSVLYSQLQSPIPIIDVSHQIRPHDIYHGAWVLEQGLAYLPVKTIFVGVVDPGVGSTEQTPLLCYWPERRQVFIAPDNGLLTPVFEAAGDTLRIYDIRRAPFYLETANNRSRTFHGRDVYAPIAAQCANALVENVGEAFFSTLGPMLHHEDLNQLARQAPAKAEAQGQLMLSGEIAHIDIFGNLITNIPSHWAAPGSRLALHAQERVLCQVRYVNTYQDGAGQEEILIVPSSGGTLELCRYQDSAVAFLQIPTGTHISLTTVD